MKKLPLFFAFFTFQAAVLYGQTFTGAWQGMLKRPEAPNGEQRIVIKISTTEDDKLAATMYSIDRGGTPVPSSAVTANGAGLKMSFQQINGAWEGRLSADGKTLDGVWTQDELRPRPLVLTRATAETASSLPDPPPPRRVMDPKASPGVEVATIKPSNPDKPGFGISVSRSGAITTLNTTLLYLIKFAYGVHPKQVIGVPAWTDADKFDITAKPDQPGSPTMQQMQSVLQKLLAERFGLTFHKEKRELSAYTITVAKGGAKVKKEDPSTPGPSFGGAPQNFVVRDATMAEFATFFLAQQFLNEPVVDQTGFGQTRLSFILRFTPDPGMFPLGAGPDGRRPAPDADAPPDIFTAMEQQLGLHVQKTKAQVDVMLIDKVSKPSEN